MTDDILTRISTAQTFLDRLRGHVNHNIPEYYIKYIRDVLTSVDGFIPIEDTSRGEPPGEIKTIGPFVQLIPTMWADIMPPRGPYTFSEVQEWADYREQFNIGPKVRLLKTNSSQEFNLYLMSDQDEEWPDVREIIIANGHHVRSDRGSTLAYPTLLEAWEIGDGLAVFDEIDGIRGLTVLRKTAMYLTDCLKNGQKKYRCPWHGDEFDSACANCQGV